MISKKGSHTVLGEDLFARKKKGERGFYDLWIRSLAANDAENGHYMSLAKYVFI